jgi:hypothetical protein
MVTELILASWSVFHTRHISYTSLEACVWNSPLMQDTTAVTTLTSRQVDTAQFNFVPSFSSRGVIINRRIFVYTERSSADAMFVG